MKRVQKLAILDALRDAVQALKGGPGSGNWGHVGRPGQVGGSGGGSGRWGRGKAPGVEATNEGAQDFLRRPMGGEGEWLGEDGWIGATLEQQKEAKNAIVTTLSEETGIPYDEVNGFVQQWAQTSADEDMRSLSVQVDAAEEFEFPAHEFTQGRIETVKQTREELREILIDEGASDAEAEIVSDYPEFSPLMESSRQRKLLRAMYDHTQSEFRAAGFKPGDTIRLYRGSKLHESISGNWKEGDAISIVSNPLTSWTANQMTARGFSEYGVKPGGRSTTFYIEVPIEQVLGTARTGLGCLEEGEFVLLGSSLGEVRIVEIGEASP